MTENFRTKFVELEEKINQLNAEERERVRSLRYTPGDYSYLLNRVHARGILLSQAQEHRYNSQTTHGPELVRFLEERAIAALKKAVEITYEDANTVIAYHKADIDKTILATWGRDGI